LQLDHEVSTPPLYFDVPALKHVLRLADGFIIIAAGKDLRRQTSDDFLKLADIARSGTNRRR